MTLDFVNDINLLTNDLFIFNLWLFEIFYSDLENREKSDLEPCHVINIDIQDNHEEATIGAFMICDLCTMVSFLSSISVKRHVSGLV